MRTGFLISGRLKSTRLPKKLLLEVCGENMLTWMIRRLKLSAGLEGIIVATSTHPQDDPLEEIAEKENVWCFRGSEDDLIVRLLEAAEAFDLDYAVNTTADCPLVPFELVGDVIETYRVTRAEFVTCYELPQGMCLIGLDLNAARKLIRLKASDQTEYWPFYFLKTDLFQVAPLTIDRSLLRENYRFVLDYREDYEFFSRIYETIGPETYKTLCRDLIRLVDRHPEWVEINAHCKALAEHRTCQDPTSRVVLKE